MLKPVADANTKMLAYVSDHMVDLNPTQIAGLKKKTDDWDPHIVQINVAEANIVDRCESCHMGIREPLKITPALMTPKGEKKPDEFARAFVSHPQPDCYRFTIPTNSDAHPAIRAMAAPPPAWRRPTGTTSTGYGLFSLNKMSRPDARLVMPPIWCWSAGARNGRSSTMAKTFSASAAAWAVTAMRDMTGNRRN